MRPQNTRNGILRTLSLRVTGIRGTQIRKTTAVFRKSTEVVQKNTYFCARKTKHSTMNIEMSYDVVVIGAGHAGCEAAAAAARLGAKTCLVTMDMNKIAQMSCNPAIGGIAKGQIVREIDALGGMTGIVTDRSAIQFRMLNRSKGPAMWSPRAQCDREKFIHNWRRILENTPNLHIWQDQVEELLVEDGRAVGVRTMWDVTLRATCVILTAGTFLNGLMHIGRSKVPGGRCSEPPSLKLTESITRHGITAGRMKTGTPVRIDARSVHFDRMTEQPGDEQTSTFSFMSDGYTLPQLKCWTCNTNAEVHRILREGLADSPLFNGQIQSIGPRYCPSIETKLVTFPERQEHPLFLEPEGTDTNELYLNGFSSSLPMETQINALRQIPCFADLTVYRPGYAIEYDFFDPTELYHSLESKKISHFYLAGQVNGTTGYEEAAGQGLMAGINAARRTQGKEPLVLRRDQAYIGVLIDDLVTKGVDEPYRMFTSRAEYRILLRQDNADRRLTPVGREIGLVDDERYARFIEKQAAVDRLVAFCEQTSAKPGRINEALVELGSTPLHGGSKLSEIISRPGIGLAALAARYLPLKKELEALPLKTDETIEAAEVLIKYKGYIERERVLAEKMLRLENIRIRGRFDYEEIRQLSTEARQKLKKIDPETLAQAGRIPGVSPSDVNVLLVLLKQRFT